MSKNLTKATKPLKVKEQKRITDDVKVNTGLPPQVDGQIRCFCKLTISEVIWIIPRPPDLALVRVKWWGEEGDGAFFRPLDAKKGKKLDIRTTARYPVRSGPCQFATYLTDMGSLTLDLMTSPKSEVIGQANINQIGQLTNTRPINGIFPVISATGQKLANLQVSLVLEPLLASFDNMGTIPTTDIGTDKLFRGNDSMVIPEANHPQAYSDMPTRPINTVFKSPTSEKNSFQNIRGSPSKTYAKNTHNGNNSYGVNPAPQQGNGTVAITTSGDVISLSNSRATLANGRYSFQSNDIHNNLTNGVSPTKPEGRDLLSVLVDKGTKLREAMIVSSMHTDLKSGPEVLPNHSSSSHNPNVASDAAVLLTDDYGRGPNSTLDLLMTSPIRNQDVQLYNMMNGMSPGTSMSSDMCYDQLMSEPEDPLHENSILQDLFYYNSDAEGLGFSDVSGLERDAYEHRAHIDNPVLPPRLLGGSGGFTRRYSLEEPGNQRPPSRASSLTSLNTAAQDDEVVVRQKKSKRKARSRSRSGSRSRSRSNSLTRAKADPAGKTKPLKSNTKENAPIPSNVAKPLKAKKKLRSRSRSGSRKRQSSVDEVSDSDMTSAGQSEISRVSFDPVPSDSKNPKKEGLSIERLTLLGRVHVARVTIDSLSLTKPDTLDTSDSKMSVSKLKAGRPPIPLKSKKANTYFVEYQFPVVASSRDKYTPNAMATEITRVASKNVKNGAVVFNHRSVFPIMFDGAAVERWWKSALVFRLYSKEAGEHTPILIGSGGISLKSILRSENLFVRRDLEIPDTSKSGLLNTSRASSTNSSLNNRNMSHLFGHLKVSVELASDHKEFATVMARTKLAEMSGNVKIVPIGGVSPDQARLVKELHKNKDQPLVKAQNKQIDVPMTSSYPTAVTGLPPQSPRRKVPAEEEGGDEISRLKQQLKATIAVLANTKPHPNNSGSSPLDSGAQVLGGHQLSGALTLYTLLYIQEGRKISITGVPPLHIANKHPGLLKAQPEGRDSVVRNTYLVCRMFWCNESVHSNVYWGTLDPEYNFLQVAPVLMTSQLLERLRDNYMIIEVWDKKVGSENDKLIGMVKLSLHQLYLSFRDRKIANALLKSEYPVLAIDNYMPIVDPFSGLHFGQLKVVLAMGSEPQIATLQRLALDSSGMETVPQKPSAYLERQDLMNAASTKSGKAVDHQFEITIEGIRELTLFEKMMWGEADCFVQFFFPAQSEGDGMASVQSIPTMKCFRTATTLCIPDPTFHDSSRHKLTLPFNVPVQRELLTACANSGGGVSGLPFEVWCRYYHPNVRDQLIAKCLLPLAKVCAMITMHKRGEPCIQSFSLRLTPVGADGNSDDAEAAAKTKSVGVLDLTVSYKSLPAQSDSSMMAVNKNFDGSQVCLSVGVVRAAGLKAAADAMAQLDSSMAYPADVGVNSYVRIKISFLGKEHERITKTVARTFTPEYTHYMDFPCPLLMSDTGSPDATSLAELLESAEVVFEVWHQIPSGLHKDFLVDKSTSGLAVRKLAHQTGDVLLGTAILPLNSLLIRRTGVNGWYPINLPSLGWAKPVDLDGNRTTALDQVAGGLELSVRFAHQDDRDRVINAGKAVGWSPIDLDVEQSDWQEEDSHHNLHNITVCIDQVSFPMASALITGHTEVDPSVRCYVRYKFYDKGAVVSKSRKLHMTDTGNLLCSLGHKQTYILPHTSPLQWYLREERLEIQTWVTYGRGQEGDTKPRQRDKLIGSCYLDMESLTDMRRGQQRISGLFPLFKPGCNNLKSAFIRAQMTARVSSSAKDLESETNKTNNSLDISESTSEMDQSDTGRDWMGDFTIDKSPKKGRRGVDPKDPASSFCVLLAVERAMHLPMVTDKNRSGEICPTTYVSYQSVERSKPTYSAIVPNSTNPVWDYAVETRLNTDYLYKENKNLVLKVWHKPPDASKMPDKASDRVLGFVSVDLTSLAKGLRQICGWYNIMDFNGQCKGQVKVSVTPQDLPSSQTGSNVMLPNLSFSNIGIATRDVASSIAHQLMSLQQQVAQRIGSLTAQAVTDSHNEDSISKVQNSDSTNAAFHWQPKFVTDSRGDDPSKSYLDSSLKRQLQDLENMTQKMKIRLSGQQPLESARSGDVLIGTQSGISTIHTVSSLSNTRESMIPGRFDGSSFDVGASQESARSQTLNNSSLENAAEASVKSGDKVGGHGRKLLDSGIYSARNFSEKSAEDAPDSHRSDRYGLAATSDNMSTFKSGCNDTLPPSSSIIGTLESGFLAAASGKTQTLLPVVDHSESSGNSHGFLPVTHRSNGTESFSLKAGEKMNPESQGTSAGSGDVSEANSKPSQGQSESDSARSEVVEEKFEHDEDDEDEGHLSERYGSYHKYRDMLDAEDDDDEEEADHSDGDDEMDVVKIVPKSLNNMSTVLSLGSGTDQSSGAVTTNVSSKKLEEDVHLEVHSAQKLTCSPSSPNAYAQDGTSVWCSDDNEDSFFQDVYESNRRLVGNDGDVETFVDSWLQEHPQGLDKEMFVDWVDSNNKGQGHNDNQGDERGEGEDSEADELPYEHDSKIRSRDRRQQSTSSEAEVEGHETLFDMRLRLHDLSGHDQGEDTPRDTGRDNPVWQQNLGTSSDEETSRSGARDFFLAETREATISKDEQQIENVESTETANSLSNRREDVSEVDGVSQKPLSNRGEDVSEVDGVSQLPLQPLNPPKSLLSNVELMDTLTSTARSKTLHSALSSSTANHSHIQRSSLSASSVPNIRTLQSTFSDVSSLPSNQRTLDEDPFTLELADSQPGSQEGHHQLKADSRSSSSRPDSGSSRASSGKSKGSQQSQRSKASTHSTKGSHVSSETRAPQNSRGSGGSPDTSLEVDKPPTAQATKGSALNMNGPHVRQVDSGANHLDKESTLDSAYIEGDHSDVPSTRPGSIVMNGLYRPGGDVALENNHSASQAREGINGDLRVDGVEDIPNFFMPAEDMQASIRALKIAAAAASNLNQSDQRTHDKVKAVSDLVHKMAATKVKAAPLSVKNKQPPSAEEAKRIAKIFSAKMSEINHQK